MGFQWILTDSKPPWVFRTLLSILIVFIDVWMVSILPLISSFPISFPGTPTTIGIIIAFMFHSIPSSLARSRHLFIFWVSFIFNQQSTGLAKCIRWQVIFLINTGSGLLAGIEWTVCISSPRKFYASNFSDRFWFVHIPFVRCLPLLVVEVVVNIF